MTKEEILVELEKRIGPLDEKAREAVSATVELIEQAPSPQSLVPKPKFQGENPPFAVTAQLSLDERSQRLQELIEQNRAWLERKCHELPAGWLMVIDGEVIAHGHTLQEFPESEQIEAVGQQTGKFPLLFIHPSLVAIEETTAWHSTATPGDSYPTLPITLENGAVSLSLTADFDTGAVDIFTDGDWLESQGLIQITATDVSFFDAHLGGSYTYLVKPVTVVLTANGVARRETYKIVCVRHWASSPFVQINPNRQALVGRGICLRLQPVVELDFAHQVTRSRW
jgi:hypothetical protein